MTGTVDDGPRLAVTLAEVASAAGVSLATASKALNGKREVNVHTRRRIEEIARTLGFFPNQQARSLMAGRTVIMAIHDLDLALNHADDLVAIRDGRLIAAGPPGLQAECSSSGCPR